MSKKTTGKIKYRNSDRIFAITVVVIMCIWLLIILYPLIFILSSSFSSGNAVSTGQVVLFPVEPTLLGYQMVFSYKQIWVAYGNTILYTVLGSIVTTIVTIMAAYPLSRKTFQGRRVLMIFFAITMFFSGGLIPTYLLVSGLGLTNTRTFMIIHGCLTMTYVVIMRTFFQSNIPDELLESAKMDGVSDFKYLITIVLPLSKAVISVIMLYSAVAHWNSYFTPLIYLTDRKLQPLQIVLQEILLASNINQAEITDSALLAELIGSADIIKYALIVVSVVPMIILYPFVQKFFEKGVMMGSLKG